ncbi:MAG: cytochrome C [Deltaproteobacteria bacterium]|nr:cytochrome C [Deltaproteobacteria bacterium]
MVTNLTLHDLPLPLPANEMFLKVLLVLAFIAHIIFVNLMVGGSILTLVFQFMGRQQDRYDLLAKKLAKTITVNKSLAVVLGVAPLLLINVLYTVFFYSANILTGNAWISVVPLVAIAFLLTYLHQYSWERLAANKMLHISINIVATAIFLVVPMIFLANVNLMLFPERWGEVRGFSSALLMPSVLPRYFHFLAASVVLTALFLVGFWSRPLAKEEVREMGFDVNKLQRELYLIAFMVSLSQLIIGPILLLTLPRPGISWALIATVGIGAVASLPALVLMWLEIIAETPVIGRRYWSVIASLGLTTLLMASGRHLYREEAIRSAKAAVQLKANMPIGVLR